ncbi:MAG: rhodanese-like domain-containing protein [Deltaproteobacteria bacterium]|nr:rhodanese-like domain-containing protein [Deltaproteobacteria bacterium]
MRSHLFHSLFSFWRRPPRQLAPHQLQASLGQPDAPLVLDVRTPEEFALGHIAGAMLVPVDELEQRLTALALYRERPIVTV